MEDFSIVFEESVYYKCIDGDDMAKFEGAYMPFVKS